MHEISFKEDGESSVVASAGLAPWHGLGESAPEDATIWSAFERANLTWSVEQVDLSYSASDLRTRRVDTHLANTRSDTGALLGVVGRGYVPVQIPDMAAFIESLVGESGAVVESVGSIRSGRRVFASLTLPEHLVVGRNDHIKRHLVVVNGHDGAMSFRAFWTSIRIICGNAMTAALRDAVGGVSIRHTANVRERVEHARQVLGLAGRHFERFGEALDALAAIPVTDAEAAALYADLIPVPAQATDLQRRRVQATRERLLRNFRGGVGAELSGATAWGVYSGLTEFTSHQRPVRGATAQDRAERAFESILLGGASHQLEQRGLDAVLRLTRAA